MSFNLKLKSLLLMTLWMLASVSEATTDKYRIMWRDNPATTMVIGWNQVSGNNPVVHYGTTDQGTNWSAYPNSADVSRDNGDFQMNNRFVRLTGLQPNTAYYFVIRDSQGTSSRFWFKTVPNVNTERLSFIAGGDSRNNREPRVNANKLVAKLRPHAVFFGGDFTDNGTPNQWRDWFDDWQNTIGSDGRMIPIVATRGNHEPNNSDLVNLFDVPSNDVYYALTFADNLIRTYTLNTEMSIGGNQTSWLANDLANSGDVIWKMAQYHKPMRPHTSSKAEGTNQYNNWSGLFEQHRVNFVVECDVHMAKTTWPIVPYTGSGSDEGFIRDDCNGTVYTGEGSWGAPIRENNDSKSWTRNSGSFNQFKWIFVDAEKIESRTIKVDNANSVGQVSDNNIFQPPTNLDIWNPSNGTGSIVTISGGPGMACDDNDDCTINDMLNSNCDCVGTFQDSDNDGVCDADDQCPGLNDVLIGMVCNDNNACTVNDTYSSNCECVGIFQDSDNDGVCDADDQCPGQDDGVIGMACNDNNDCTVNDIYDSSCDCIGTVIPGCGSCRYADSLALIAVYNALNGNTWESPVRWNFAQPMDTWSGVSLNENGCVDKLDLPERTNMSGIIAPEIGDLSEVTSINLSTNNIDGIPSSIGNLTNLELLNLNDNNLGGLPAAIGDLSSLKYLHLSYNNMGGISSVLGNLTNLEALYLSHNNIGGINAAVGNLTNLQYLHLSHNNIGGINPAVGNLINLKDLYLDHNNMGGINAAVGNLVNLEGLYLNDNNIGGITSSIGNLINLKDLNLDSNNLGGLPAAIGDLSSLERLYLSDNNLGGLNSAIGNLSNLEDLHLDHNRLGGINAAVGNLTNLKYLYLNHNNLGGVNAAIGNLSNLTLLHLNDNQITAKMYSWLADMESLVELNLHNNNMYGCFNSELSSLCGQLSTANISDGNDFEISWESFCNDGACPNNKIEQNQAIDTHNFPNPFSNQTMITYTISEDSPVTLRLYDGAGKQVALLHNDEIKSAGTHSINFEGGAYPAGMYYYIIQAGAYSGTQKMVLMR